MAAFSGGGATYAEVFTSSPVVLGEFVQNCDFPKYVVITDGTYLSKTAQVSEGDVLLLESVDYEHVTLSYFDDIKNNWREINIPRSGNTKFTVLTPKDRADEDELRARPSSIIVYPTISDLLLDSPTYFEATAAYDDPYLPGLSIRAGERFRFVKIHEANGGGLNLEVKDDRDNTLILTSECRGNFCPLKDPKEYTIKELVDLAPVPRRLKLVSSEKTDDSEKKPVCSGGNDMKDTQGLSKTVDSGEEDSIASARFNDTFSDRHHLRKHFSIPCGEGSDTSVNEIDRSYCLPMSTSIHMLTPEPCIVVSPYGNPSTVWKIPISANIRVKLYSLSDYEIPQTKTYNTSRPNKLLAPLSPYGDMPKYSAPSAPPIPQPLVPLKVNSFADIYLESLPAKAKLLDISKCNIFFQDALRDTSDLNVYRLEEENRLFVKDEKSDDVYSLSQDLHISFLEYPEKFHIVSELLELPIGTELTILEDIASDFPRPISLRFGEVIRICTNTRQLVKMKYANQDCEVLKVEKIDPGTGEISKLKLPTDFEVRMTMSTNSCCPKPIPLQDILKGAASVPSNAVASLLGNEENQQEFLIDFPSDVVIIKAIKQAVLVVAPKSEIPPKPQTLSSKSKLPRSHRQTLESMVGKCHETASANIGLPVTCGAVLGFQGRLDISDMDTEQFNANYTRLPIEKLTMADFEERELLSKLNTDYEDMGQNRSDLSVNECGTRTGTLHRTSSTGVLDGKTRRTNLDKVRRFSRALNPKHWRHSRQEPEALPHPTAMGLMALAARPPSGYQNEYQHEKMEKSNSMHSESTNISPSSDEDETENFYEDIEIGPIKSATMVLESLPFERRKNHPFSTFLHKSLPSPRRNRRPPIICKASASKAVGHGRQIVEKKIDSSETHNESINVSGLTEKEDDKSQSYDVSKTLDKALQWASKLGNKIQARNDVSKSYKAKEEKGAKNEKHTTATGPCKSSSLRSRSPEAAVGPLLSSEKAPSQPVDSHTKSVSLGFSGKARISIDNDSISSCNEPVAPVRRKKMAKSLEALTDASKENLESSSEDLQKSLSLWTVASEKCFAEQTNETSEAFATEHVQIQPLPRKSLIRIEPKANASLGTVGDTDKIVAPPKPKPRGLKIQTGLSSQNSKLTGSGRDVVRSFELLAKNDTRHLKEAGVDSDRKQARAPPPIKPRLS
ncbi:protein themis [Plakobranchus ocellatus]|uniref:Protein themis n=1 Tax=Plakobranchus ocellatus TaxID=259542 RepID=A0AAV4BIW5_9GAST|nr:protein themis [Plakobranchus ocellatus]